MRFLIALLFVLSGQVLAGPQIQHWVAPTGAKVYFVASRSLPILDVNIDFVAGGARSPADKAGVASLTASLLEAGLADLDEEQISARLVDLGARLSSGSDLDKASVSLRTLSSPEEKTGALALMRAVLSAPTFPEGPLAREKIRTIEALKDAETRPDSIVVKRFAAAAYTGHPYGRSATPESVAKITRDDLVQFHKTHYVAGNAVISILGDVSRAEAEAIAIQLTEFLPAGREIAPLPPVVQPGRDTLKVAHPATQSHIRIGLPAVKRDAGPDYFALLVGNYTLGGGGFVSRLMKEVREKRGYAYSVYSTFSPRVLPGPFEIGLQTKREQAGDALKVVEDVLTEFLAKGPTEQELAAAKKNLIDGQALRIDSNAKLLGYLSLIGFYGLPLDYLDQFPRLVAAITRDDVKAAFQRHIKPEHLVTVIVAAD
ncbi:MAG: pitrilysin family protein [Rhodocyclaceae bacterium]|nr:pitrilysin family protein [Rhodocyclaceae bacterium]MDZ4214460.1 pitrilysin family protein [Rhodocyclaceae bacterium]